MIKLNKPSDCCGCTACASVCSHLSLIHILKKCINRLNQEDTPFTVDRIIELYTAPEGNCTFLLYGKELLLSLIHI